MRPTWFTTLALLAQLAHGHQGDSLRATARRDDSPLFLVQVGGGYNDEEGRYVVGKWGYIDTTGSLVIAPRFAGAEHFAEGLARARVEAAGKCTVGFINGKGEFTIVPSCDPMGDFSDGRVQVSFGANGPYGYMDRAGGLDTIPQGGLGAAFSEGMAKVDFFRRGYGYVDTTCKLVIAPQFDRAEDFSDGLALVGNNQNSPWSSPEFGYIDKTGSYVVHPQVDTLWSLKLGSFFDGLAVAGTGNSYGYIDKSGAFAIKPQFDEARAFSEGLAVVRPRGSLDYGYIDKTGKLVIKAQFVQAWGFHEGLARVRTRMGGHSTNKCGYIDKTGRIVVKAQFGEADDFHNGLARVCIWTQSGKKVGYIDKTGKYVWETK